MQQFSPQPEVKRSDIMEYSSIIFQMKSQKVLNVTDYIILC